MCEMPDYQIVLNGSWIDLFGYTANLLLNFHFSLAASFIYPYRAGTELTRFNYVNIMAADVLAPYVARTSAAMILVM